MNDRELFLVKFNIVRFVFLPRSVTFRIMLLLSLSAWGPFLNFIFLVEMLFPTIFQAIVH